MEAADDEGQEGTVEEEADDQERHDDRSGGPADTGSSEISFHAIVYKRGFWHAIIYKGQRAGEFPRIGT